jgi:hypothetical protein
VRIDQTFPNACHCGAGGPNHIPDPLVDGLLEREQAVLRIAFAVDRDELEPGAAQHSAAGVDIVDALRK